MKIELKIVRIVVEQSPVFHKGLMWITVYYNKFVDGVIEDEDRGIGSPLGRHQNMFHMRKYVKKHFMRKLRCWMNLNLEILEAMHKAKIIEKKLMLELEEDPESYNFSIELEDLD